MAIHSSMLAWRIPRTEEPGRLQSMGSQGSDTIEVIQHTCTPFIWPLRHIIQISLTPDGQQEQQVLGIMPWRCKQASSIGVDFLSWKRDGRITEEDPRPSCETIYMKSRNKEVTPLQKVTPAPVDLTTSYLLFSVIQEAWCQVLVKVQNFAQGQDFG